MTKDGMTESLSKRKKTDANDDHPDHKLKKKRKKSKLDAPSVISEAPSEEQRTKNKKQKKKKIQLSESTDLPSCPEIVPEGEEDLSPEERRVFERKMKKILRKEERKRLREEGKTPPKKVTTGLTAAQLALDYLTCWTENKSEWKFQKTRQTWLLQHMFDSEQVSDDKFRVLLQYLEGLQGAAKDTTVQKALDVIKNSETHDTNVQQRAHRAREVIQLLS